MKKIIFLLSVLFSLSLTAQSGEVYEFENEVVMKMSMYEDEQEQHGGSYSFLFPEEGEVIGMIGNLNAQGQTKQAKAIFNQEDQSALVLMDHGGMKMGMKMNAGDVEENSTAEDIQISKTGRSKEILGYTAEEYEVVGDEAYSLMWMSQDVDLPNFYKAFVALNKKQQQNFEQMPEGFMLEMTSWPEGKDSSEKMHMQVTEVNTDVEKEISTEGYRIMQMPTR